MKAVITGATSGIGKEICKLLLENNWEIIGLGRNKKQLFTMEKEYFGRFEGYYIDLTNQREIEIFFKYINDKKIDMLVNCAGIGAIGEFENMDYESIENLIGVNIQSFTQIFRYFLKKDGVKYITNVSSTAGFQSAGPYMALYYASKSFITSLTLGVMKEKSHKNIQIMLLCPGPTSTEFIGMRGKKSFYITTPREVAQEFYKGIEKKRIVCISGWVNKILYFFNKILPRNLELYILGKIQRKKMDFDKTNF